jgi:integrase/recombinase XerD
MEFRAASPVPVDGPLAPFAGDFRRELAGGGYSPRSGGELMRLAARLSRWLDSGSLTADDLTAAVAGEFFRPAARMAAADGLLPGCSAPLLECLQIAPANTVSGIPVEGLFAQYRDYLRSERGLAASTVSQYLRYAAFISLAPAADGPARTELAAGQIAAFVMTWCRHRNASQAKMMVTALRSLLRFLHVSGYLTGSLSDAVPSLPGWRKVRLPRPLHAGHIAAVLAGPASPRRPVGAGP